MGQTEAPVHIVGHSVGDAVAIVPVSRHPERAVSLTSVEGNFTLKGAFWSAQIAQMPLPEVEAIIAGSSGLDCGLWGRIDSAEY